MIFHFVHEFPIQQIFDKVDDSVVAGWLMRRSVVDPKGSWDVLLSIQRDAKRCQRAVIFGAGIQISLWPARHGDWKGKISQI